MKKIYWGSSEVLISDALFEELSLMFNADERLIANWLHKPKAFLENKAPIDIMDTGDGLQIILELLHRIKTGDLS